MNKSDFNDILKPILTFLEKPKDKEQIDNLFDLFQSKPQTVLERAVNIIIETYPYKTFPTPHYFFKAIDEAQAEYNYLTRQPTDEPECPVCYGMGIKLIESYCDFYGRNHKFAVPCSCSAGQRMAHAWRQHDSKHKYFSAKPRPQTETYDPDVPF